MVSELLQDRPRLAKQMGSIIFIPVCNWIFKFPLGYLNNYQRTTLLQSPFSQKQTPWKLLSKEAAVISSDVLLLVLLVAKPSHHQQGWPNAACLWKSCCCLRQSGVSTLPCWPRRPLPTAERAMAAVGYKLHGSPGHIPSSLPSADFVSNINSQSRKDVKSWSSAQGLLAVASKNHCREAKGNGAF